MSGFFRSFNQAYARKQENVVVSFRQITCLEDVSARVKREADPFNVDDPCPVNPAGHKPIASCGDVVCWHCAKVF